MVFGFRLGYILSMLHTHGNFIHFTKNELCLMECCSMYLYETSSIVLQLQINTEVGLFLKYVGAVSFFTACVCHLR